MILHEGQLLPGVCIFSNAELKFRDDINFYAQFWISRRSTLQSTSSGVAHAVSAGGTGSDVTDLHFWSGYLPGEAARAGTPRESMRQSKPSQRCWRGLNKTYDECHKPLELRTL
jgi:hypothetical protein